VAHRLSQQSGWFPLGENEAWLLSSLRVYQLALGAEPYIADAVPLVEIPKIAPPRPFVELWRADLRQWFTTLENPSEYQAAALCRGLKLFSNFD
jgi:hypothetical protein